MASTALSITAPHERHRPELTALYQLIDTHWPFFREQEVRGFNVHARTIVDGRDRAALERLCRYVARPPPLCPSRSSCIYPGYRPEISPGSVPRRSFDKDVTVCAHCGGPLRLVSLCTDPASIDEIIAVLGAESSPPA